jgi:hypothetical protein
MTEEQPAATDSEPPLEPTAPESYRIELRGFDTEESAHSFANLLRIETGTKTITAVHSQCRCWVKSGQTIPR